MTSLITQPQLIAAAATDVAEINSAIGAAKAAAAGPTTGLVAAAQDEVSAVAAALFGGYGKEYQALLKQAAAFHEEFAAALAAAGNAYAQAEAANASAISAVGTTASAAPLLKAPADPAGTVTTLVLGASGYPIPQPEYIEGIPKLYIDPFYPSGINVGVNTPEGLYPLTGVMSLTFNQSVSQGLTILNNAIQSLATPGNTINVFGYSQSAAIVSLEMQALNPTNTLGGSLLPSGVNLNFTLVGDVSNPNGGLLARFPGLSLPSLGFTFGTATPDNSFPTRIYTIEYDGFADFPQYPIDVFSDLNGFIGILTLHGQYPLLTPTELANAVQLTNTVGPTQTEYLIVPTSDLLSPRPAGSATFGPGPCDTGHRQTNRGPAPTRPDGPRRFGLRQHHPGLVNRPAECCHAVRCAPAGSRARDCQRSGHRDPPRGECFPGRPPGTHHVAAAHFTTVPPGVDDRIGVQPSVNGCDGADVVAVLAGQLYRGPGDGEHPLRQHGFGCGVRRLLHPASDG